MGPFCASRLPVVPEHGGEQPRAIAFGLLSPPGPAAVSHGADAIDMVIIRGLFSLTSKYLPGAVRTDA
jgi:hypothetical protein